MSHRAEFKEKYSITPKKLGMGAVGSVFEGIALSSQKKVAVKIIYKSKDPIQMASLVTNLTREIKVMKQLSLHYHRNIMQFYDYFEERNRFIIVLENATGGDLFDRILHKTKYTEHDARDLFRTLSLALSFLHRLRILHRDIKPENVLMASKESDSDIKIADFGLAIILPENVTHITTDPIGSTQYMAPEILSGKLYSFPADIWSLGVLLFIILSGTFPFDDEVDTLLIAKIKQGNCEFLPEYWDGISPEAIDLIQSILRVNPAERFSFDQILAHPWMVSSEDDLLEKELAAAFARLKVFDAKRKLKCAMTAVRSAVRLRAFDVKKRKMEVVKEEENAIGKDSTSSSVIKEEGGGISMEDNENERKKMR